MKQNKTQFLLLIFILLLIGIGVSLNIKKENSIDRSKIPEKVEQSKGFQKWITNLKNKDFIIEADEFRLQEENEIYNTKWIKIYSIDAPGQKAALESTLKSHVNTPKVVYSPSEREFLDYRNSQRDGYAVNEVRLYGLRDDKIMDARIVDCSTKANCYFDRGYFLDNDTLVVSEISRTIDKEDLTEPTCDIWQQCEYSFKIHVIDLKKNSRLIYESKPFKVILENILPNL